MPLKSWLRSKEIDLSHAKILVVDDQPVNIQAIYSSLNGSYVVLAATSGEEALDLVVKENPDLILMDVVMPGLSGLDTCRTLKLQEETSEIPVIFITGSDSPEEENDCWDSGGIDFISKPVNPMTLRNRVKSHLMLKYQKDMLLKMVYVDGLTGVFNRRYLDEHLIKHIHLAKRTQRDTSVLLIDIDFFKQFNDRYGHVEGDAILKKVAATIQNEGLKRMSDFIVRYGGEEFVVILPETDLAGAEQVAERIRQEVQLLSIEHLDSNFNVLTISIGVTGCLSQDMDSRAVVDAADKKLYQAKISGRNRVCA
ncbi:diguanylate cyclase [Marinomonas sp. 15G1-11]|uniref:diguanylate cyclase n=1 Tax=Marinomonas phaeophyticola TaxID=3004091 RepID=A0ABT4JTH1_9GAMM|nr:diguanylate cyclase [Marinomonas sp. 15G1-11]MCZ2721496.1 diguanylate cyclase [Marinomonas sp. 15G1-11]